MYSFVIMCMNDVLHQAHRIGGVFLDHLNAQIHTENDHQIHSIIHQLTASVLLDHYVKSK